MKKRKVNRLLAVVLAAAMAINPVTAGAAIDSSLELFQDGTVGEEYAADVDAGIVEEVEEGFEEMPEEIWGNNEDAVLFTEEEEPVFFDGEAVEMAEVEEIAETGDIIAENPDVNTPVTGLGTVRFTEVSSRNIQFKFHATQAGTYRFTSSTDYTSINIGGVYGEKSQAFRLNVDEMCIVTVQNLEESEVDVQIELVPEVTSVSVNNYQETTFILENVNLDRGVDQNTEVSATFSDGTTLTGTMADGIQGYGGIVYEFVTSEGNPANPVKGQNYISFRLGCDHTVRSKPQPCTFESIEEKDFPVLGNETIFPYRLEKNYTDRMGQSYYCYFYQNGEEAKTYEGTFTGKSNNIYIYKKDVEGNYCEAAYGHKKFVCKFEPNTAYFIYATIDDGAESTELTLAETKEITGFALTDESKELLTTRTFVKEYFEPDVDFRDFEYVVTYAEGEPEIVSLDKPSLYYGNVQMGANRGTENAPIYEVWLENAGWDVKVELPCALTSMRDLQHERVVSIEELDTEFSVLPLQSNTNASYCNFTAPQKGSYNIQFQNTSDEAYRPPMGIVLLPNGDIKVVHVGTTKNVNVSLEANETVYCVFTAADQTGIKVTVSNLSSIESIKLKEGEVFEKDYIRGLMYYYGDRVFAGKTFEVTYNGGKTEEIIFGETRSEEYGYLRVDGYSTRRDGPDMITAGQKEITFKFEDSDVTSPVYTINIVDETSDAVPSIFGMNQSVPKNFGGMHCFKVPIEKTGSYRISINSPYKQVISYDDEYDQWNGWEYKGKFNGYRDSLWMEEYKAGSSVYVAVLTDSDEPISVSIDKVAELESFTLVNDVTPVFIEDFYTGWVPDTVMEFELLFEDGKKERFHFGENSSYYGELHVEHSWQGWEETSENPHLDCYFANYPDIKMEVPVSLVNLEEANVPVIDTIGTEHVINRNFNNSNMFCFIPKVDGSYRFRIKENGIDVTESAGAEYLLVSADDERTSYFNHENVTVKLKAGDKLYVAEYAFEKDITVSVENGNPIEKIVMKGSVPKSYIWEIVSYGDDSKYWEKCSFEITFKDGSTQTVQLLDEKVNGYGIVYCAWPWKEGTDEEVAIGDNLTLQFKVKGCEDVTCDITPVSIQRAKDMLQEEKYKAQVDDVLSFENQNQDSIPRFNVTAETSSMEGSAIYEMEFTNEINTSSNEVVPAAYRAKQQRVSGEEVQVSINGDSLRTYIVRSSDGKIRIKLNDAENLYTEYYGIQKGVKLTKTAVSIKSITLVEGQKILRGDTTFNPKSLKFNVTLTDDSVITDVSAGDNVAGFGTLSVVFGSEAGNDSTDASELPIGTYNISCTPVLLGESFDAGDIEVVSGNQLSVAQGELGKEVSFSSESIYNGNPALQFAIPSDGYYEYTVTGAEQPLTYQCTGAEVKRLTETSGIVFLTMGACIFKAETSGVILTVSEIKKEGLQNLYNEIVGKTNTNYTFSSWETFVAARTIAKEVLENPKATQKMVNDALADLEIKVSNLVYIKDLSDYIATCEGKNLWSGNYTYLSWSRYQNALSAAKNVLADGDATQDEVDAALAALKNGFNGLEWDNWTPTDPPTTPTPSPTPTPPVPDDNGTIVDKDGTVIMADGTTISKGEGTKAPSYDKETGETTIEEGNEVILASGDKVTPPAGSVVKKDGSVTEPDGTVIKSDGTVCNTDGSKQNLKGEYISPSTPMLAEAKVYSTGNQIKAILSDECKGAEGYDYVISENINCIKDKDYYQISKNQLRTNTVFRYLPKGTYYVYCHAWKKDENGIKKFSPWSNYKVVEVTAATPQTPKIERVRVRGNNVYVTYTKCKDATGYDIVLGSQRKKVLGEYRPVEYGNYVKKVGRNTYTAVFTNVKKGTYYAGLHAYNRTSEDGKKVFSPWSNNKTVKVTGK